MKIVETTTTEEAMRQAYAMIDDAGTEFVVGNDFGGVDLVLSIPETEFEEEVNEVIASFRKKKALEELKAKSEGYEVVVVDETTYFVKDSVPIEELEELDGEPPRWDGWSLYIGEVAENGFVNSDAVCW